MEIRPSAAVRAALAAIERSDEGRTARTRQQSRAMEKSVTAGAAAARMSAARVADSRAHAEMLAEAIAAERHKASAPRIDMTARDMTARDMTVRHGGQSMQQPNQPPRPGSVVDLRA